MAFLDDDATAAPDWVEQLAGAAGILISSAQVAARCRVGSARGRRGFPMSSSGSSAARTGARRPEGRVRNIYGGCFCIRREVFDELGGFLIELGRVGSKLISVEETELCIRAGRRWPDRGFSTTPTQSSNMTFRATDRLAYFRKRCFAEGVSKARLTRLVGSGAGLASERRMPRRALPAGVAGEIGSDCFGSSRLGSGARCDLGGTGTTPAGYGWSSFARG